MGEVCLADRRETARRGLMVAGRAEMGSPWTGTPSGDLERGQTSIHARSASPAHRPPQTDQKPHPSPPVLFTDTVSKAQREWHLAWGSAAARGQEAQAPGPLAPKQPWGKTPPSGHGSPPHPSNGPVEGAIQQKPRTCPACEAGTEFVNFLVATSKKLKKIFFKQMKLILIMHFI